MVLRTSVQMQTQTPVARCSSQQRRWDGRWGVAIVLRRQEKMLASISFNGTENKEERLG